MTTSGIRAVALWAAFGLAACEQMAGPPLDKAAPEKVAPAPVVEKVARAKAAEGSEVYKIALADSAARGASAPKVTLVAFSEFQCPFCARVTATLDELAKGYGDDLRIVFKHRPLPFHDRALPAALAAEAAGEQGKFWQMHDKMFQNQKALAAEDLERYAGELGLDVARWKTALAGAKAKSRVDADMKLADQFGVNGTPSFFINGRMLVGAQPIDRFRAVIDEELKKADQKLAAGVARAALYEELTRAGLDKREGGGHGQPAGKAGPCPGGPGGLNARAQAPEADDKVYKVDLGGSPARGPRDAIVTVTLFSDFQCPFCSKVEGTLAALEKEYTGKVRVVWKNFPLAFHEQARPAALAAYAAGEQGQFWAMHDKLIQNQNALAPENLERYAEELGLDLGRWKTSMASAAAGQAVDADMKQGESLGVSGTPSMFINGRKVVGAQPLDALKPIVEEELAKVGGKRR
jgi:protein-disulfide isomerase